VSGNGDRGPGDLADVFDVLDEQTVDALVAGEPIDARFDDLAAFAREARALSEVPPPRPSSALAEFIARGGVGAPRAPTTGLTSPTRRLRRTRMAAGNAGLGPLAKVTLAGAVGLAGFVAAGAAGVLPASASRQVRHVIEATTPIEFHEPADVQPTQDRPATTDSHRVRGSAPTTDARSDAPDANGQVPNEPGQTRGRQDTPSDQWETDRSPEGPSAQDREAPTATTTTEPAPTEPADSNQLDDPAVQEPDREAPTATTTTEPAPTEPADSNQLDDSAVQE
jgi:hypothetical protein